MSQTITISVRASESGLQNELRPYLAKGWRVLSKQRGSWWGKIGTTYNWRVTLEKPDEPRTSEKRESPANVTEELTKLAKLKADGAITEEEYEKLKKRLLGF